MAVSIQPSTGLNAILNETGKIYLSVDGLGTSGSTGVVQVQKRSDATVRKAYLLGDGTTITSPTVGTTATVSGTSVAWEQIESTAVNSSFIFYSYLADVTALVKPTIDAAAAGVLDIAVDEGTESRSYEGLALAVLFDDPNQISESSVILYFGGLLPTGATSILNFSSPVDTSQTLEATLGLGIGFSYNDDVVDRPVEDRQTSQVTVNGQPLTLVAGNYDDGLPEDGALFTVGGFQDNPGNPPPSSTDPATDDELYNLLPFINNGDSSLTLTTVNPSNDDHIFFAHLTLGGISSIKLPSIISFNRTSYRVREDGTRIAEVTVTRSGGLDGGVSVTVIPTDGTAIAGNDYDATPITVSFSEGQRTQAVVIPIIDNVTLEGDKTLNLTLSDPTGGAVLGSQVTSTLTIEEDELPPVLQVRLNLRVDNDGVPGDVIENHQVGVNQSFFVEVQVADLRSGAAGVVGLGLNLAWEGFFLESINFDPAVAVTSKFPLTPDGTLSYDGLIDNLSGGSLPAFELGQAIGVNQLETFAMLHFRAENTTNGEAYFTTTVTDAALADDSLPFSSLSLDVETYQPIVIGTIYRQYNFTYTYGNGDSYTGYVYAAEGFYTVGQVLSGINNETGNDGQYTIDSIEDTTLDASYNNRVYVTSYTDGDTGFGTTTTINPNGNDGNPAGYYGLGSEYGYATDANGNSADSFFNSYYEADILANEKYSFTYHYGNGDSYSGYGYAAPGTYTVGQEISFFDNETGSQKGYYRIDSIELGNTNSGLNNTVYVTSYTDGDTGFGTTTTINPNGNDGNPAGYSGLGSESGYATDANGLSSDSFFSSFYEADILNQYYAFTYTYGNGDSYSGFGYALAGTYFEGQTIGTGLNETGNEGFYTINSVSLGTTDASNNNRVYVTSYTDADTLYGTTTNVQSYGGSSGLGSEDGYAYTAEGSSYDAYFSNFREADLVTASFSITDNSGIQTDSSIKFTTELSKFRRNYADSDYVRSNYADTTKHFDITNTGAGVLVVSDILVNVTGVSVNLDLSGDQDLLINPGQSQRVTLRYAPTAAKENFNVSNGLVLKTNALNLPEYQIALSGKSTFDSDINYDGRVTVGDNGVLNAAKRGTYDPTADIDGNGVINQADATRLIADQRLRLSVFS